MRPWIASALLVVTAFVSTHAQEVTFPTRLAKYRQVGSVADLAQLRATNGNVAQTLGNRYVYRSTGRSGVTLDPVWYVAGSRSDDYWEAVDRTCLDLEAAGLAEDQDITALLSDWLAKFTGNKVCIKLPTSINNLECDYVLFPTGLDRIDILAGNCTITQSPGATRADMWEINDATNIHIERGVRFAGHRDAANFTVSVGLISIKANGKATAGGAITSHASISSSTSMGLRVTGAPVAFPYDEIVVSGIYQDSCPNINCQAKRLSVDVTTTDPDGYAYSYPTPNLTNQRGFAFGQVTESFDIKVKQKWGYAPLFGFACPGAVGTVKAEFQKVGYKQNGDELSGLAILHTFSKVDTIGSDASVSFDYTLIDCSQEHTAFLAESSPGPTNNTTWRINGKHAKLQLGEVNDEGNKENFNNILRDSSLASFTTGPGSKTQRVIADTASLKLNTGTNPDIPFKGAEISESTILESVDIGSGTQTKFTNVSLPGSWTGTLAAPTVLGFRDCRFPVGTQITPTNPEQLRIGLQGTNSNLSLANLPVEALPYLRLDAVALPDEEDRNKSTNSHAFETINRPVGWNVTGPAKAVYYSGTTALTTGTALTLRDIDKSDLTGGLTFTTMSVVSSDTFGSIHWPLGVDEGRIEAAITFKAGGENVAGVWGRGSNDFNKVWLRLDRNTQTVELKNLFGVPGAATASAAQTINLDQEYILALEIDAAGVRGYVDGVELITRTQTSHVGETHWGIKHRDHFADNADQTAGPHYRYIEVRPIAGTTGAIETERRGN